MTALALIAACLVTGFAIGQAIAARSTKTPYRGTHYVERRHPARRGGVA